jgi:cytosine/adenosine deaminase-related metal-dependent hydrolase
LYRKFTAPYIFTGTTMLTQEHVLITTADGTIAEITAAEDAGDDIEILNGILCPGFINTHCHLELSHLKGIIAEHTGLVDFVFKIVTQRNAPAEQVQQAIKEAEDTMLLNGIVAVGDICNSADTLARKKISRLYYHNFIEIAGFVPDAAHMRFNAGIEILQQFEQLPSHSSSINPHAPYSVSPQLLKLINEFYNNTPLSIHNQETLAENDFFKTASGDFLRLYQQLGIDISFYLPSGKSSLQTVLPQFTNKQSILLVHNICTDDADIKAVHNLVAGGQLRNAHFCLCPNANLYISNSLPNVNALVNNKCNIVLGTDSLASNHQLSILEEMKTLQHHFPAITTLQLLKWATYNGAGALQINSTYGSFDTGKKPGIVLIENTKELMLTSAAAAIRIL